MCGQYAKIEGAFLLSRARSFSSTRSQFWELGLIDKFKRLHGNQNHFERTFLGIFDPLERWIAMSAAGGIYPLDCERGLL